MKTAASLDKSGPTIQEMFAGVAPRYDFLNRLLSARRDIAWRKRAAKSLELPRGSTVVDLCCGTGDQAIAVEKQGYRVVAADFCVPMLAIAQNKYSQREHSAAGLAGDTMTLPFADGAFDGATASFGLRNVSDLSAALAEIARVLRPGGHVSFLECAAPDNLLRRPYLFYFTKVLPKLGAALSPKASAYTYLPNSVVDFPQREVFAGLMQMAGFDHCEWTDLSAGAVCLYTGVRNS